MMQLNFQYLITSQYKRINPKQKWIDLIRKNNCLQIAKNSIE